VEIEALASQRVGQKCFIGVDVGKLDFKAVVHWSDGSFHRPWRIKSPCEITVAVAKLVLLNQRCPVTVAMESSGTYGDAFRQALSDAKIPVLRVSGKMVKDQSESFDGVPSQHDGKDGAIIAELAGRGKGRGWDYSAGEEMGQQLRYWVRKLERAKKVKQVLCGRIESLLARHWPEAGLHLKGSGATLIKALGHWGDPAALARDAQAAEILAGFGGHYLTEQKIATVIDCAATA
jgi:transposase